jgi:hypothetical protein
MAWKVIVKHPETGELRVIDSGIQAHGENVVAVVDLKDVAELTLGGHANPEVVLRFK